MPYPTPQLHYKYAVINTEVKWKGKDNISFGLRSNLRKCHIQVHLSRKLHPHSDATSEPYKPAFHGGHLSHNTSYGSAATIQIFHLPQQRYSYSTRSSITELLLLVFQY